MPEHLQKDPQNAVARGLEVLQDLTLSNLEMEAEWEEAWAGFSQVPASYAKALGEGSSSCGRFREWFLLERHSPTLLGTPLDRLIDAWRGAHEGFQEFVEPLLQASFTGIFEVREVVAGQGAWLRDISGFGEYALADEASSHHLEPGDLLVGRLFPWNGTLHLASGYAAWFRSTELRAALERDLGKARETRRSILRIGAPQLEMMFFAPAIPGGKPMPNQKDLRQAVLEARKFLHRSGLSEDVIFGILQGMESSPMRPDQLLPSPSDPVGRALERLAFETDLDLTEARRILTEAWQALSLQKQLPNKTTKPEPKGVFEGQPKVREAVERFAEARASGGDLEQLFFELERDLGLSPGSGLDEEDLPAPDFPGVVGAMVEEFLWDSERQGQPIERRALEPFTEFAQHIGLFEELSQRDILSFATFWVLERHLFQDAKQAAITLQALEAFCRWAEAEHSLQLYSGLENELSGLHQNLPRIAEINRRFGTPLTRRSDSEDEDPGQLFALRDATHPEACQVVDREGQTYTARLPEPLCQALRPGDHLRASIDLYGNPKIYCIYPPEASALYR